MSGENNRSLNDPRMDALDHALGRPTDPHGETTRNFFGVEVDCDDANAMKADSYWTHTRDFMGTSGFAVSDEGAAALRAYLKENWTPPRRYIVAWGESLRTIEAKTRSKAKYLAWLDMDFADLSFGDYAKNARARLARY
jgi:hypothetical protein